MTKYSVVIPCFNEEEETFRKCLSSWKNQTVKPLEVIVVNDRGNKKLEEIVKEFKFKYIYNEIKGNHGRARNTGFKEAKGDYIISCNADDYVEITEIEEIDKVNNGEDTIMIGLQSFGNESKFGKCTFLPNKINTPYTSKIGIYSEPIHIVKRQFIMDNNIFLKENLRTADVDWVLEIENKMKTWAYVDKILYHWNWNNKTGFGIGDKTIREDVVVYIKHIHPIGGIGTWLYEIAKKYSEKRNITLLYKTGDLKQLRRLKEFINCKIYDNEKVECETVIFCYDMEIIDNITAVNYDLYVHGDMKQTGVRFNIPKQITNIYAVSKVAQQSFIETHKEQLDKLKLKCEVVYNPLTITKPRRVLRIISATRLTKEKGAERINSLARRMRELNIPFVWTAFCNDGNIRTDIKGLIQLEPELNIVDYIANSDYLVQLSDTESYGYSIVEALCLGIPVVVTNMPVVEEIGVEYGVNGFILKFDLSNLDEVIKDMYEKDLKGFKYKQLESDEEYKKILGPETEKRYSFNECKYLVKFNEKYSKRDFNDSQCLDARGQMINRNKDSEPWLVDEERKDYLLQHNAIVVLEEIKEKK